MIKLSPCVETSVHFCFCMHRKMIFKEFFTVIHESSTSESLAKLINMWRGVCVCVCVCVCMLSHFSHSDSCDSKLLCSWHFPHKNAGEGCHFLLQGNFPTLGLNPSLFLSLTFPKKFFTTSATWEAHGYLGPTQILQSQNLRSWAGNPHFSKCLGSTWASQVMLVVKNLPTNARDRGDVG